MAVDFEKFLSWAQSHFGNDIVVKGDEIRINSPFVGDDFKHHLWCNPYGGKHNRQNGVFRCFKSGTIGTLPTLVMMVEKCDYDEAIEILGGGDLNLSELYADLDKVMRKNKPKTVEPPALETGLQMPPSCYLIEELPSFSKYRKEAETYLKGRKMPLTNLYVCTGGKYKNRIMIPYYDRDGKLIYFNGRFYGKNKKVSRYLGPEKEIGVGKSDVVYMPIWPMCGEKVYITEGEFDAISIYTSELNSAAMGGKELSDRQFNYIKPYEIVLCVDNDSAGNNALIKIGTELISRGIKPNFIRPPTGMKDWNDLLIKYGPKVLKSYILKNEKPFTSWTPELLACN